MGRNLVEQQDRRRAAAVRHQLAMGEDQAEQKRLLLTRRAIRSGDLLGAVKHSEVVAMRAFDRAARAGVARPVRLEASGEIAAIPSFKADRRACEFVVGHLGEPLFERRYGPLAGGGHQRSMLRHRQFQRREPNLVPRFLGKQLVARSHRRVVARRMVRVAWLQREHQAVEESPPVARAAAEQPVHRRGQP